MRKRSWLANFCECVQSQTYLSKCVTMPDKLIITVFTQQIKHLGFSPALRGSIFQTFARKTEMESYIKRTARRWQSRVNGDMKREVLPQFKQFQRTIQKQSRDLNPHLCQGMCSKQGPTLREFCFHFRLRTFR